MPIKISQIIQKTDFIVPIQSVLQTNPHTVELCNTGFA